MIRKPITRNEQIKKLSRETSFQFAVLLEDQARIEK